MANVLGWLTIIDASGCDPVTISNEISIKSYVKETLDTIKMEPIGKCKVEWCETTDPDKVGYTIFQIMQDSSLSAHFFPKKNNTILVDCHSCKHFDEKDVERVFRKYFKPDRIKLNTMERYVL